MPVITMRQITKHFGHVQALRGVDLEVPQGEVYGFIGPNGAGKTTTIRILLGMIRANTGEAHIFGRDVWNDRVNIQQRIAYVPGEFDLWPKLTGGEVIDFLLHLRGTFSRQRKEELIQRFDLDPNKRCNTYSKGNRQKVLLIAAFASEADVLILDEPTSGLDPFMEHVFQSCIAEVKDEGKTVLLSSHILSEVEKLCDKVSFIRAGRIVEQGTLDELRHLLRIYVTVTTRQPIPGLHDQPGVYDVKTADGGFTFQVDTNALGDVIRYISQFDIVTLNSTPATLEDVFMHHYGEQAGGADE